MLYAYINAIAVNISDFYFQAVFISMLKYCDFDNTLLIHHNKKFLNGKVYQFAIAAIKKWDLQGVFTFLNFSQLTDWPGFVALSCWLLNLFT